jgi:hypothetical protein
MSMGLQLHNIVMGPLKTLSARSIDYALIVTTWIDVLQWIVVHIRKPVETLRIPRFWYNSIGRDPAA